MLKRSLLLIFLVIGLMCGSSSAGYYIDSQNKYYITDYGKDLNWLETTVSNSSLITHDGKTWYINMSLSTDTGRDFYINNSVADVIYWSNYVNGEPIGKGGIETGAVHLDGVYIYSWNYTSDSVIVDAVAETGDGFDYKTEFGGSIKNTTINGSRYVYCSKNTDGDMSDITLINTYGFTTTTENSHIENMNVISFANTGAVLIGADNHAGTWYVANNSYIINSSITGCQGLLLEYANNLTLENVEINDTSWSGLQIQQGANSVYGNNITINYAGHSGIDVHGAFDVLIENATVLNSDIVRRNGNSIQVTTSTFTAPSFTRDETTNVTFRNIYADNAISGLSASANPADVTNTIYVYDSYFNNHTNVFEIANTTGTPGLTIINCTMEDFNIGIKCVSESDGVFAYDSDFRGGSEYDVYIHDNTGDGTVNLINCLADNIYLGTGTQYNKSYYLNAIVQNTTAYPVEGVKLEVTQTGFGLNGLSSETYTFYSESNGRFTNGGNRSNYPALQYMNYDGSATYYTYNITASKSGQTDTEYAVSLSSYGYSSDLSDLNGTLYTFVLDVAGEGEEPAYWTPTEGYSYIGIPETWTWNAITGQFDITFSGTYTEPQTEITGVEVRP